MFLHGFQTIWLSVMAIGLSLGICQIGSSVSLAASTKPNIVFIMADDLGIGDTGVTGQLARAAAGLPAIQTPNIDTLANQGMRFNNMYASAPICSPSRLSLLTGFSQGRGIKDRVENPVDIRGGDRVDRTWGSMLQDEGYKTGMFGKWHLGGFQLANQIRTIDNPLAIPVNKGFDIVYGSMNGGYRSPTLWESDGLGGMQNAPVPFLSGDDAWPGPGLSFRYSQDMLADKAEEFIRTSAVTSQPFAAYVPFQAPHIPLDRFGFGSYADESWPDVQKQYAAMITRLDQHVGQLMAALDDPNDDGDNSDSIAGNTIVVFTSDNGPLWSVHNNGFDTEFFDSNLAFNGEKANTLEGGIRVPFFVRWDGTVAAGTVNDTHLGTFADIMPTLAELTGGEASLGIDGKSMLSVIQGEGPSERPDTFNWFSHANFGGLDQQGWALRMGDWKFIKRMASGNELLFNLATDPNETMNLASSRSDIVTVLKALAFDEGPARETVGSSGPTNTYFNQYKSWAPTSGSDDFSAAANWSGGTQFRKPGDPDAQDWNTGPADNWLALVENTSSGFLQAVVNSDTKVLAAEIRSDVGIMAVRVDPGVELSARNGIRVGSGGVLILDGGRLNTIREIDIRLGGLLVGEGVITGQQQVLAAIPEFQGQGLLEPELVNAGIIQIDSSTFAGLLMVDGQFEQTETGVLSLDLFGNSGVPGQDFDQLSVSTSATVGGAIDIHLSNNFVPNKGDTFEVISAGSFFDDGISLVGSDASNFIYTVVDDDSLILVYTDADFDLDGDVDGADFLTWQRSFGQTAVSHSQGDANGDNKVDHLDLLAWQSGAGGSPAQALASVPEPSTASLALLFTIFGVGSRSYLALWKDY